MRLIDADALLQKLCNDNPASMEDYYYNAIKDTPAVDIKTEVAREIFAEIEGLKNKTKLSFNSKELQGLEKPINSMIRDAIDLILLELKNKYTKGD